MRGTVRIRTDEEIALLEQTLEEKAWWINDDPTLSRRVRGRTDEELEQEEETPEGRKKTCDEKQREEFHLADSIANVTNVELVMMQLLTQTHGSHIWALGEPTSSFGYV